MRLTHICICGKLCTSIQGLILHQRHCQQAKDAISDNKKTTQDSDIIEPHPKYCDESQEFIDLADLIAFDSNKAISNNNKSAGRRARVNLLRLREMIIPLREKILTKMKRENK